MVNRLFNKGKLAGFFGLTTLVVAATTACHAAPARAPTLAGSIAFARVKALDHSIAIWRWFRRSGPDTEQHYAAYVSDAELAQLKAWGFTAVRLPVGEPFLFGPPRSYGTLDATHIAVLLKAITRINAAGLAVVVDYHADTKLKAQMETDAGLRAKTVTFWQSFAKALSGTDPSQVMLELLNEPRFLKDPEGWNSYMVALHNAARAGAPRHTIVIDSSGYAALDTLPKVTILDDPNVIYTVHFYEPMDFTGQGLDWNDKVADLTWPSGGTGCGATMEAKDPATVAGDVAANIGLAKGPGARARRYCAGGWDVVKMNAQLAGVAAWSRSNARPVWIGEFGVRGEDAPDDARQRWFTAAARAFAQNGLPWSLWSYDDCWGLSLKVPCNSAAGQQKPAANGACAVLSEIGLGGTDCVADLRRLNLPVRPA